MLWTCEWDCHEWPIVILLTCIDLLSVHLLQVLLCQDLSHLQQDGLLSVLSWKDSSDCELLWLNTESQDSIDVGSNDLEMHQGLEYLLERVSGDLVELSHLVIEFLLKDLKLVSLILPLLVIVVEWLGSDTVPTESLNDIVGELSHGDDSVNSVTLSVMDVKVSEDIWSDGGIGRSRVILLLPGSDHISAEVALHSFAVGVDLAGWITNSSGFAELYPLLEHLWL